MRATFKTLLLATLTTTGILAGSTVARAQSFKHIHRLVTKLERQLNVLHGEVDAHFRPFPQYIHLHKDVERMERLAEHIHDLVDAKGNLHHVLSDVKALDSLYHHVRALTKDINRSGRVSPGAMRHINQSLRAVGDTIHHLRDDLEELDHRFHRR